MSKLKPIPGFTPDSVDGADGELINPGDDIIVCSVQGVLGWGTFLGVQYVPAVPRSPTNRYGKREVTRFYYMAGSGLKTKRKFINTYSITRSDRILKR